MTPDNAVNVPVFVKPVLSTGPVSGEVVKESAIEHLNANEAFIKSALVLVLENGDRFPFANPEYFDFKNNEEGRKSLAESAIDDKYKDTILALWE